MSQPIASDPSVPILRRWFLRKLLFLTRSALLRPRPVFNPGEVGEYPHPPRPSLPFLPSCRHTGSFSHLVVTCLCLIIRDPLLPALVFYSATSMSPPPPPCLPDFQRRSLALSKISFNVSSSCFLDAVFHHHGSWRLPPPPLPVSLSQTSNIGCKAVPRNPPLLPASYQYMLLGIGFPLIKDLLWCHTCIRYVNTFLVMYYLFFHLEFVRTLPVWNKICFVDSFCTYITQNLLFQKNK